MFGSLCGFQLQPNGLGTHGTNRDHIALRWLAFFFGKTSFNKIISHFLCVFDVNVGSRSEGMYILVIHKYKKNQQNISLALKLCAIRFGIKLCKVQYLNFYCTRTYGSKFMWFQLKSKWAGYVYYNHDHCLQGLIWLCFFLLRWMHFQCIPWNIHPLKRLPLNFVFPIWSLDQGRGESTYNRRGGRRGLYVRSGTFWYVPYERYMHYTAGGGGGGERVGRERGGGGGRCSFIAYVHYFWPFSF